MSTEAAISDLHRLFAELSGRSEPIRFHTRFWFEILRQPEYNFDPSKVEPDLRLIVSYLKVQIREDKRNLGSLKLRNFLAVDQWFADLAEAQQWQDNVRKRTRARPIEQPKADVDQKPLVSDAEFQAAAARLRDLTASLAGGMKHE